MDQLCRAAALCSEKVQSASTYPAGYDGADRRKYDADKHRAWLDAEGAREVRIGVIEQGGFQRALGAIDDLRSWPVEDIARIESIDISIGEGQGWTPVSGKIELGGSGIEVRLSGRDRMWTAGLRHELEHVLNPRVRLRPRGFGNELLALALPVGAFLLAFLAIAFTLRYATSLGSVRYGLDFAVAIVVAVLVGLISFRLPWTELLEPDAPPTYQRWKGRIIGAVVALVVGIAAGVIVAAITS